jgi:ribonucleoside-diphosphate reductase alpha chain
MSQIDTYLGIQIDYSRDELFTESGYQRLKDGYMLESERSPQERFAFVSKTFSSNPEHAQRLYEYSSKMWLSYATPILSYGKTKKSLPISCFASYLGDSMESILATSSETRMLAVVGGGVGLHVGLRPGDRKSSGIIPHLKTYDVDTLAFKQGTTRRGATAAYLSISHPEIIEFLEMRKPTGGDPNRKCLNLHHGINISDDFMKRVEQLSLNENLTKEEEEELDKWELINEHTGLVTEVVSIRELWERILTIRHETGEPYLWFIDTANEHLPEFQKRLGLKNRGSNLCSEISLVTKDESDGTPARTFVCCLSSLNLEKWDEWKGNKQFIRDIVEMLDNVIDVFIKEGSKYPELSAAIYSAAQERSIGIGALGWHSLLQKRGIPFESALAIGLNNQIWDFVGTAGVESTLDLGDERGPCPDSITGASHDYSQDHYGDSRKPRNAHVFSIAPNASSSIILGTSPSIEATRANVYLEKGVNGTKVHRNKYLETLLDKKECNTPEVWSNIISNDGSVAGVDCLDEYEKDVFKTAMEIDQTWIIQHAADRQKHICQSQSVNLFFSPDANVEYLHLVHLMAWQKGLKSLYYLRSDTNKKADKVGKKVERQRIEDLKEIAARESLGEETCVSCEG